MDYKSALEYLEEFVDYEKFDGFLPKSAFNLERMRWLLGKLGEPQTKFKSVHIAGSKGKGSTSAMVFSILKEAGFKVGLYTSPHLDTIRERIRTDSGLIEKGGLAYAVERLKPFIDEYSRENKYGPLSFFELYTAIAFLYFARKKVRFAVLEVGLGGRLDATNAADGVVSVITALSHEHTDKLGETLLDIAREKAEIIKKKSAVISAAQHLPIMRLIEDKCAAMHSKLYIVGRDISFENIRHNFNTETFDIKGILSEYEDLRLNLRGEHQIENAALAVGVIDILKKVKVDIAEDAVRTGLADVEWPGRCEVAGERPLVVLDGAQNRASARAIKETVTSRFDYDRLFLLLGVSREKDIAGICAELEPIAEKIILTSSSHPRAAPIEEIMYHIGDKGKAISIPSVDKALDLVFHMAFGDDLILITGSLFLVADARRLYNLHKDKFKRNAVLV